MHERLGSEERFRFMGRTSEPQGVMRGGDMLLMTGISEAMPVTLLEAMAQARPSVPT
jgi:polysaccharide biosynthesis protein PelF